MTLEPPRSAAGLEIERCSSLERLEALEPEWIGLLSRARHATPFQHPAWLLPWYREFAPDRPLFYVVRDGAGRLRALLPGAVEEGRLTIAGGELSDYRTVVIDDESVEKTTLALADVLHADGWRCELGDIPAGSIWAHVLGSRPGWTAEPSCVCPVVPLPDRVSDWRDALPSNLDRNLRRYAAKLEEGGSVRFETVAPSDGPAGIAVLLRLHARRWHQRGEYGVLGSAAIQRFHQSSGPRLIASNILRIHVLRAGSQIVAAQYVLVMHGRAFSYIGGFDPAWARFSPGTLLMAHSIAAAIGSGCVAFDLLRGVEPYKYLWGAINRTSIRLLKSEA